MPPTNYPQTVNDIFAQLEVLNSKLDQVSIPRRERIAMAVLAGMVADAGWTGEMEDFAHTATFYTDALIAELDKEPQDAKQDNANNRMRELEAALEPFAKFACDPPCGCHNCKARELLPKG